MTLQGQHSSWWQKTQAFVRESLRDNELDFTRGPVGRALGLSLRTQSTLQSVRLWAMVDAKRTPRYSRSKKKRRALSS